MTITGTVFRPNHSEWLQVIQDMFKQIDYVILGVSDMISSVRFYKETLGLPLAHETKEWTEFQTGKTKLALHPGSKKGDSRAGPEIVAGTCQIGFEVADLDKTYRELQSKGVRFVMPPKTREGEGIKLAVCLDPDGLPISISESIRLTQSHEATMPNR